MNGIHDASTPSGAGSGLVYGTLDKNLIVPEGKVLFMIAPDMGEYEIDATGDIYIL